MEANLVEHKFVIILNGIQLETAEAIQCSINYKYPLFSKDEQIIVDIITIPPNNTEYLEFPKGSAYIEHVVPWSTKESDVKLSLEENHLIFKILDKNIQIGTASANLSRLKTNNAEKTTYGFRYCVERPILNTQYKAIGKLDFIFVLEIENFTRCRSESCQVVKRNSSIIKHVVKSKCRKSYTDEQFKELQVQSKARQKDLKRKSDKERYDPAKRSERHKRSYKLLGCKES